MALYAPAAVALGRRLSQGRDSSTNVEEGEGEEGMECMETYTFRENSVYPVGRNGPIVGTQQRTQSVERAVQTRANAWLQRELKDHPECKEKAQEALQQLVRAASSRVLQECMNTAWREAQRVAKRQCPVDTGRLQRSLGCYMEPQNRSATIAITSNVEYANYVRDDFAMKGTQAGVRHFNQMITPVARRIVAQLVR